jgi:hypothetical protein
MTKRKYTYWQDGSMWLGYLEEYPDYMTQGDTLEDLQENLRDIYLELTSGTIPAVRLDAKRKGTRSGNWLGGTPHGCDRASGLPLSYRLAESSGAPAATASVGARFP